MTLKVIGAGFGRTGTNSLKLALEKLCNCRCYHMFELIQDLGRLNHWQDALAGRPVAWDALFDGFGATVDWPSTAYWAELAVHYPDAKIILSLRDSDNWYKSISQTIFPRLQTAPPDEEPVGAWGRMVQSLIADGIFNREFDRESAVRVYEAHNARVIATVPPERLLVHEPGDGWEPLCKFLGVPIPDEDYPRTNSTDDFNSALR